MPCRVPALVALCLLAVGGCRSESTPAQESDAAPLTIGHETLVAELAGVPDLAIVAAALDDVALAPVFDGAASYTILAPTDAAFAALGQAGTDLRAARNRPQMAAVLRDHVLPGFTTIEDIEGALAAADGAPIEVQTMGDHTVTITGGQDAGGILFTSVDGTTARLAGPAHLASNGVAIPIDAVLKDVQGPSG